MSGVDNVNVAMRAHYVRGLEEARLDRPKGMLEFERSKEIIRRALPRPPARVADLGGGPGRYAFWLAGLGYEVEHRDAMPLHVDQVRTARKSAVTSSVGDARATGLPDGSVAAVLLLGPLYHLDRRDDRIAALREACRILQPGGVVFAAAISRWSARLDGALIEQLYLPIALDALASVEETGVLEPLHVGGFCGYLHRPDELADEIADAGLVLDDLVGVEGLPLGSDDLARRLADPVARRVLLDCARSIERVPELLGLSSHLMATAHR